MPSATGTPSAGTSAAADRLRVSFVALGQLSRLKGTLVLLDAIALLPPRIRRQISVEIHGSSRYESEPFHTAFDTAAKALQKTVRTFGPYRHEELGGIIQRHGWVIQPSLWWENSPLVIQEAFAFGRPVICSNIGGMAEKVTHGVDGLHFRVGSPGDLAATIERCVTEPTLWSQLRAGVKQPPTIADTVDELLAVYGREPKRMERALDQSKLRV
jgi:glycosyltransferase involved in cell wall biosynthesis